MEIRIAAPFRILTRGGIPSQSINKSVNFFTPVGEDFDLNFLNQIVNPKKTVEKNCYSQI
jgi:hypothetical protein